MIPNATYFSFRTDRPTDRPTGQALRQAGSSRAHARPALLPHFHSRSSVSDTPLTQIRFPLLRSVAAADKRHVVCQIETHHDQGITASPTDWSQNESRTYAMPVLNTRKSRKLGNNRKHVPSPKKFNEIKSEVVGGIQRRAGGGGRAAGRAISGRTDCGVTDRACEPQVPRE